MASALDALPPIKDIASTCMALKCTEGELFELKKAIKFEMAQEVYGGQALLGVTNFRNFDPHHKHRDEVQRRVAESDPVAQEIFEGSRWPAADRAAYQKGPLVKVLDLIIRQLSALTAQQEDRKEGKRIRRKSRNSTTEPESSSPIPEKRRTSERKSSSSVDIIDLGSSPAQPAVPRERFGTPAQSPVTGAGEEEIEDTPQRSSKRQRLVLGVAVQGSPSSDEKQEEPRSHGPTPSPLTCNRRASNSSQRRFSSPAAPPADNGELSVPLDVEPQTNITSQTAPASQADMVVKEEERAESSGGNFPANSLAAQMQNTIFQLVDARVDSRKLELADELNTMIDQSVEERVAEELAIKEKEMEQRITAHVMAELIKGFSGSAA